MWAMIYSLIGWLARRNEGVKTIEAELERALFEAGGISQANYGFLQKVCPSVTLAERRASMLTLLCA